MRLKTIKKC